MRGKPFTPQMQYSPPGITPAGAGKTGSRLDTLLTAQDHPRRCGENLSLGLRLLHTLGSPPQVRGKLHLPPHRSALRRITPAGAGKTVRVIVRVHSNKDHPRRCGENYSNANAITCPTGSPPQVRGKPAFGGKNSFRVRITPAGAGKTTVKQYRVQLS